MTPDARHVAFTSLATDLVEAGADPDSRPFPIADIFLADLGKRNRSNKITQISVRPDGEEPNGGSTAASLSADARFIAFGSSATDLIEADALKVSQTADVFLVDRQESTITSVSQPPGDANDLPVLRKRACGTTTNSYLPVSYLTSGQSISSDGQYTVFVSYRNDLVPSDNNDEIDVFVYDRVRKRIERISIDSTGSIETFCSNHNGMASISGNGRFVVWESPTNNFIMHDGHALEMGSEIMMDSDVFIYDRVSGAQEWVSRSLDNLDGFSPREETKKPYVGPGNPGGIPNPLSPSDGSVSDPRDSGWPWISHDGSLVTFFSKSEKMVQEDWDAYDSAVVKSVTSQVFLARINRKVDSGTSDHPVMGDRAGFGLDGIEAVDDRVGDVPLPVMEADISRARVVWRPALEDLFFVLEMDDMKPLGTNGDSGTNPSTLYGISLVIDGTDYEIRAQDGSRRGDLIGLFECSQRPACRPVAQLRGGIGTTGEAVVVSLPKELVADHANFQIAASGYSALGTYLSGPQKYLDVVTFSDLPVE